MRKENPKSVRYMMFAPTFCGSLHGTVSPPKLPVQGGQLVVGVTQPILCAYLNIWWVSIIKHLSHGVEHPRTRTSRLRRREPWVRSRKSSSMPTTNKVPLLGLQQLCGVRSTKVVTTLRAGAAGNVGVGVGWGGAVDHDEDGGRDEPGQS